MMRWLLPLLLVLLPLSAPATPTPPSERFQPHPESSATDEEPMPAQAHVYGKYRGLLRKICVPQDLASFQRFHDWGHWNGTEWAGHRDLPTGYWVYVYPNWYIWREVVPGR